MQHAATPVTTPGTDESPARARSGTRPGWGTRLLAVLITAALTVVIVAPIALSSQDLVRWASAPSGLGLPGVWAWLAFVALDAAAAVCVGMVSVAAWRGEPGGSFHVLTWLFALGSAFANYRHGQVTPARDDEYFFPAMSIAGPLLLDVTLARIRRWSRLEARTQMAARPRFGMRWLPGVGFRETLRAWQASLREDIARPADAIAYVREVDALTGLDPADALRFAWQALGTTDPYVAWQWLVARGVRIDQGTILAASAAMTAPPAGLTAGSHRPTPALETSHVVTAALGAAPAVASPPAASHVPLAPAPPPVEPLPAQPLPPPAVETLPSSPVEAREAVAAPGADVVAPGAAATARDVTTGDAPPRAEPHGTQESPPPARQARPARSAVTASRGATDASRGAGGTSRDATEASRGTDETPRGKTPRASRTTTRQRPVPRSTKAGSAGTGTTRERLADAVQMLRANGELSASELAEQLRALGWTVSDRTATRVLTEARATLANPVRLSVAR